MPESKADLILHPVRMRIITSLVGGNQRTAAEMSEQLSDVPQATLYRHLSKLVQGGVLNVIDERRVRGAVEKTYSLSAQQAALTPEDLANASVDDQMRYFMTFLATLMGDFGRYLQQDKHDYLADGVGYRQVPLYLSDAEFMEMAGRLNRILGDYVSMGPAAGRRRRMFSTIVIPEPQTTNHQQSE